MLMHPVSPLWAQGARSPVYSAPLSTGTISLDEFRELVTLIQGDVELREQGEALRGWLHQAMAVPY